MQKRFGTQRRRLARLRDGILRRVKDELCRGRLRLPRSCRGRSVFGRAIGLGPNAIHVLFAGEKVRPGLPPSRPGSRRIAARPRVPRAHAGGPGSDETNLIPPEDQVHLLDLLEVGLIRRKLVRVSRRALRTPQPTHRNPRSRSVSGARGAEAELLSGHVSGVLGLVTLSRSASRSWRDRSTRQNCYEAFCLPIGPA